MSSFLSLSSSRYSLSDLSSIPTGFFPNSSIILSFLGEQLSYNSNIFSLAGSLLCLLLRSLHKIFTTSSTVTSKKSLFCFSSQSRLFNSLINLFFYFFYLIFYWILLSFLVLFYIMDCFYI